MAKIKSVATTIVFFTNAWELNPLLIQCLLASKGFCDFVSKMPIENFEIELFKKKKKKWVSNGWVWLSLGE